MFFLGTQVYKSLFIYSLLLPNENIYIIILYDIYILLIYLKGLIFICGNLLNHTLKLPFLT